MDSSLPSTNAVSASNLFRLAALLNEPSYTALAKETLNAFEVEILQYPWLFVGLLASIIPAKLGTEGIFIISRGEDEKGGPDTRRLSTIPRGAPRAVMKMRTGPDATGFSWLLNRNRELLNILKPNGREAEPGVYRWREKKGDYPLLT
jgi:hypothetical protein